VRRIILAVAAAAAILLPGFVAAAPSSAATKDSECTVPDGWLQNVEGAWLSATATSPDPSTVIATKSAAVTDWCLTEVSGNIYTFEQYGTYRCLTIDSTYRTLYTGACDSTEAEWNLIASSGYPGYFLLQDWANKACVYQNGLGGDVTYDPCDNAYGQTSDVWGLFV
jgi:hypothetical protein